jgi:hypothetical protein
MAGRKVFAEQDARRCWLAAQPWRGWLSEWARAHRLDSEALRPARLFFSACGDR